MRSWGGEKGAVLPCASGGGKCFDRPRYMPLIQQPAAPTAHGHQDLLERSLSPDPGEAQDMWQGGEICARAPSIPAVAAWTATQAGIHVRKLLLDLPILPKPPRGLPPPTYQPAQPQPIALLMHPQVTILSIRSIRKALSDFLGQL